MKLVIAAAVALLAFAGTAQAGGDSNQKLCAKSWSSVQSESGGSFSSISECASSRGVFAPILSSSPAAVTFGERVELSGSGFHPLSDMTMSIAVTGQAPYFVTRNGTTLGDGSYIGAVVWQGCSGTYDVTVTITDSFGVHASTRVTLC